MWQEFVKVLGKLTAAYERLAALAQEKQAALAGVDMERLEQLLGARHSSATAAPPDMAIARGVGVRQLSTVSMDSK